MADNVGYTPGTGAVVAADEIDGVLFQRMKLTHGQDGTAVDASAEHPVPVEARRVSDLSEMLMRLVKLMESNAVVDSAQRQRITVDAFAAALGTVTTVTTVGSVTNIAATAGMDREQYINIAKQTYNGLRAHLSFV
jgi:hypothetical protein